MRTKILTILGFLAIGLVSAERDLPIKNPDLRKKFEVMQLLRADLTGCDTDEDCASNGAKFPTCSPVMKFCKPEGAPEFELTYGDCKNDTDCRPKYFCKFDRCHFGGPYPCDEDSDCPSGTSQTFECKELVKSAPGKRCWTTCETDHDCYECEKDKCRIMGAAREKIGCCNGNCQKQSAC